MNALGCLHYSLVILRCYHRMMLLNYIHLPTRLANGQIKQFIHLGNLLLWDMPLITHLLHNGGCIQPKVLYSHHFVTSDAKC